MKPTANKKVKRYKAAKNTFLRQANARGVFAVRRRVSPESYSSFDEIIENLHPELVNAARIFERRDLGVTVIGFSRFDRKHCTKGPATALITEKVDSVERPIEVRLGGLAVFGPDQKPKLGIHTLSLGLEEEVEDYEDAFETSGFPLRRDPNDQGVYTPHCSIALLYRDHLGYMQDPRTLRRLNAVSGLGQACNRTIILEPVPVNSTVHSS